MISFSRYRLRMACRQLQSGGVIAYPTETVYGLGCDPLNVEALEKIIQIKGRDADKGMILLVAEWFQALPFVSEWQTDWDTKLFTSSLNSRATTWLFPKSLHLPSLLTGKFDKIAIRKTSHPLARQLCLMNGGPLTSTSANFSGQSAVKQGWQVQQKFGGLVDCVLKEACGGQAPSQVVDLESGKILRH